MVCIITSQVCYVHNYDIVMSSGFSSYYPHTLFSRPSSSNYDDQIKWLPYHWGGGGGGGRGMLCNLFT